MSDAGYRGFTGALVGAAASLREDARVAEILTALLAAAREAWPALSVDDERFGSELARRMGSEATTAKLEGIKADDVYLAIAASDGDDTAIATCVDLIRKQTNIAGSQTNATAAQVADEVGHLHRTVFTDEPPRHAAIREYSGRGEFGSYVRVMAIRDLVRAVTRARREIPLDGGRDDSTDDLIDRLVPAQDPELSILRAQYQGIVDDAMRAAVASLDDRGRALLRYQLVERWTVDEIGRAYRVHRATAARWVAAVREEIGTKIRLEVAARLDMSIGDVDSIVRLVQSRVDVSLDRALKR